MLDNIQKTQGLAKLLLMAKTEGEMSALLHDLLTSSELKRVHERAKIFACLQNGLTQRETKKRTKTAIATVTHRAHFLRSSALIIGSFITSAQTMPWWQTFFGRE